VKAIVVWGAVLVALALAAPGAEAQCFFPCIPRAPDACGPGYYSVNSAGGVYGPNYNVYPPYLPFQGMVFPPCRNGNGAGFGNGGPNGSPTFPTHPWARSPRDYFMVD
jgi:hypothetical protein